jgi:hypothetical protein
MGRIVVRTPDVQILVSKYCSSIKKQGSKQINKQINDKSWAS